MHGPDGFGPTRSGDAVDSQRTLSQVPPGWHPDPLGPAGQMRWWDGRAWSASVQMLSAPESAPVAPRPKRTRRVIGWAALGGFALAVTGTVVAISRGQDVCEVSATGVKFCDEAERRDVEQAQDQIGDQASQFEDDAREQGGDDQVAAGSGVAGAWTGDNGFSYLIEQWGPEAVITEVSPEGLTTATGIGTFDGQVFLFDFQAADGSIGFGELTLSGDTLTGSFSNLAAGSTFSAVLRR